MNRHPAEEEATSDYGESYGISDFTSIQTSRLIYEYEHGRRYQGLIRDRYGMPNDEAEQLREGIKHKLYADYILEGKAFLAPVGTNPQKVVDLGTGVGYWALDVAERYPSARVIGTDLSPIQPQWTAPNAEFHVEDIDDERPWSSIYAGADVIHTRALLQTIRDPRRLLKRAFDNLRPGGWIECHELIAHIFSEDETVDSRHPLEKLYALVHETFSSTYRWNLDISPRIPGLLRDIGFVNMSERRNKIPMGRWHNDARMREMGIFNQIIHSDWIPNMLAKHEDMGLTAEEAHQLGQDVLDAFNNTDLHGMNEYIDCWAQKPQAA